MIIESMGFAAVDDMPLAELAVALSDRLPDGDWWALAIEAEGRFVILPVSAQALEERGQFIAEAAFDQALRALERFIGIRPSL